MTSNAHHPRDWKRGDLVLHRNGGSVYLARRKEDDSGWWVVNGGGLNDRVALNGDWLHISDEVRSRLFADDSTINDGPE